MPSNVDADERFQGQRRLGKVIRIPDKSMLPRACFITLARSQFYPVSARFLNRISCWLFWSVLQKIL